MTAAPVTRSSDHAATSRARAALLASALLVVFMLGTLAGFVYAHEPSAPESRLRLVAPASSTEAVVRGTISTVAPDLIEVSTAAGPERLRFASGTPVEDLAPLAGEIPEGAPVNVGGHRTESGFVITGIVVLPGGTP